MAGEWGFVGLRLDWKAEPLFFDFFFISLLEKVKKFLQEYYKDEEVGGKQFKYGDQLVSGWGPVGVRWPGWL